MKKIINIFFIIILIIIFDLIFTLFIFSKFNYYEIFYPNKDHRISNEIFHHSFKKNVKTFDYWGSKKYEFTTNSLGFKDNTSRKIINDIRYEYPILDHIKTYIILIVSSFLYFVLISLLSHRKYL